MSSIKDILNDDELSERQKAKIISQYNQVRAFAR